jgi:exosome complex component CSL4
MDEAPAENKAAYENDIIKTIGEKKEASSQNEESTSLELQELVLPGDVIGTVEEFILGNNTFKHGGNIYSTATGLVSINKKNHVISVVQKTNVPLMIKKGDVVIGRINELRSSMALVEIAMIEGKDERDIVNNQQAAIHVSNIEDRYVKDILSEFSPFDIIKAKVIDIKSMRLTTSGKNLGVIKAFCRKCHETLVKQSNNGNRSDKLKCPVCGNLESRKLSSDYSTYVIQR